MKRKNKILLAVAILAVIAGASVAIKWNKPHPKVEDQQAIAVPAAALYAAFTTNEQHANALYLNKTLQVTGTVNELSKNQDGKTVVLLDAGDPLGGIQCTFRDTGFTINPGESIRVKGFCNGYTMVVLLNDCIAE